MIAVTGASGKLGQLVIENLVKLTPPSKIIALVRDPGKAQALAQRGVQVRKADYEQAEPWPAALQGVEKLLLISSSEVGRREAQHRQVISAAKKAGVQHLAYTSILRADTSPLMLAQEHLATEEFIRESGLAFTLLRNGWYLENHTENLGPALQYGVINAAAQNGRFSSASRADFAEAAAKVLVGSGHANKIYELAGDQAFTLSELAAEVSGQSGKSIRYQSHSFEDYKNMLIGFGLPAGFAEILADSDRGAATGALESHSRDLHQLIGRATTSLSEAVHQALSRK